MEPVTFAVIGLGSRGKNSYGREILRMPDRAKVVAIADTDEERLSIMGEEHSVPSSTRFHSAEELFARPKLADAAIICTQDRQHVPHAIMALEKGYDVLLEKPVSPDLKQLQELVRVQKKTGRRVVVCHVLRYTPFFRLFKDTIDSGILGRIISIEATENVVYWHQAHSFVRGNWRREDETSPMILAKCCHDLDYLVWLSGQKCSKVSSFGSLSFFREENAPEGSTDRCLCGCLAKKDCPYDCEKIYLTNERTGVLRGKTGWPCDTLTETVDEEHIRAALETGPYGRCVFRCDNDVVDHQMVNMEMEDGATLSLNMCAFTEKGGRTIKVMGTLGDMYGDMSDNMVHIRPFGKEEKIVDVKTLSDNIKGHGGGDRGILESFISLLEGNDADPSITTLETSVESHLIALAAEKSRKNGGKPVDVSSLRQ